jgi:hypothetical protein
MLKAEGGDLSGIGPPFEPDDQIRSIKIGFLAVNDLFHLKLIPASG